MTVTATNRPGRTLLSPGVLRSRRGRAAYWLVLVLVFVVFTVAFLLPMVWMLIGAMKPAPELAQVPPTILPHSWQPQTYPQAWDFLELGRYFVNTIVVTVGAWLVQLAVAVPASYALSKLRPKLGNVVLGLMLATLMLPASSVRCWCRRTSSSRTCRCCI
ncbi:ABC transporter permease family protein [Fodinicola feengrottensis]|uniref:hypothetical protein n=1 Tax=Fodinicola feengrottensis TaxID=435914 RepID=UPI0024430F60|nr:hypothetical protein [Fodinicola feengrottensis]